MEGLSDPTLILVDSHGHRAIIYRGTRRHTIIPALNPAAFQGADAIYAPGNFVPHILDLIPPTTPLVTDVEHGHFDRHPTETLLHVLHHAAVVIGNEGSIRAIAARLEAEPETLPVSGILVITQGRRGATVVNGNDRIHAPALRVTPVDTTGAGDCFAAAFSLAWLEKMPLQQAARFAATAASLSTTALGARSGSPARRAVEERLRRRLQEGLR